jgi:protein involved in polysaccharide export with SLBB domain/capsular polysaccharide biosynthesis protein
MNYGHEINFDETDASTETIPGAPRTRRSSSTSLSQRLAVRQMPEPQAAGRSAPPSTPFDGWALLDSLLPRWYWLLIAGVAAAIVGAWVATSFWTRTYTASAQIVRYDAPVATDSFKPQALSTQTLLSMIKAPELFQRVGAQMAPPRTGDQVAGLLKINPERDSEVTTITASTSDLATVVNTINLYTREAIKFTQEAQQKEAREANEYVTQQLASNEADQAAVRRKMDALVAARPTAVEVAQAPTMSIERLQAAKDELAGLLARYTEVHPLVKEQRARVAALSEQIAAAGGVRPTNGATSGTGRNAPKEALETEEFLQAHYQVLDGTHAALVNRQRAVQAFLSNPPGYFRVLVPATAADAHVERNRLKVGAFSGFCGLLGIMGMSIALICVELLDDRLKTGADVKRVTRLPLLATLGDLRHMSPADQDTWAFRTWTALQRRLSVSPNHGMVCGITSANNGDGRTTWINLLARAANQRGFRVLTIATGADPLGKAKTDSAVKVEPSKNGTASKNGDKKDTNGAAPKGGALAPKTALAVESSPLTANVLSSPKEVADKLTGPNAQPVVHIPLPGWVWSLERRKQWQSALTQWRKIDNVVILVELPPASVAESVLLAENLPNLIWLTKANRSDASDTRTQLETLRHARCNLVGAVLNHESNPPVRRRFSRWIGAIAFFVALVGMGSHPLLAQTAGDASFSVVKPQRAAWQQHLTLGPGDVITLSLFGQPELTRAEVPIGPDGRVSYLEAQNIQATGLTVDELRNALNEELGKYRRAPQAIVVPVAYRSKKFIALGAVVQKGVFPLERPMTVIEAVAMAKGLETGLTDRNVVELADFSQSFLARNGQKVPVDFEKLFQEGDLSQNVPIEPGDYLYFPPANRREVYVLGEVMFPGVTPCSPGTTALSAIARRGGFNARAWKGRIVVVRGSLNHPETLVVDAGDVLSARAADLRLKPKDIIYVSHRPFIKAEEILDLATSAFVESAVVGWTGLHVTPTDDVTPVVNPQQQ